MNTYELLVYTLPALVVAVAIVVAAAMYVTRVSRYRETYYMDKLRLDLEVRMAELSKQLQADRERFQSINHLILEAQSKTGAVGRGSLPHDFLRQMGVNTHRPVDPGLVVVLQPFNPVYDDVYRAIKQTVGQLGFRVVRGDEAEVPGNILTHVLELLISARLVIANISGRNPNVFYELGIAHALGKQVLILSETVEDIPFDIRNIRVLMYRDVAHLAKNLSNWLAQALARTEV
jgi:hypothetical protein